MPALEKFFIRVTSLGVLFAALTILSLIIVHASKSPPSFDGAMNLQVAWSLSEGEGYRRTYADRPAFPAEVQTNVPFILPAAAVFKLFGMGVAQAQATNLIYLIGLALVAFLILHRNASLLSACLGVLILACTPGILSEGLNGYGEIPGLFWAALGLLIFPWQHTQDLHGRVAFAGACLSLAVLTKTVMAIFVGVFGLAFALAIIAHRGVLRRQRVKALTYLAFGLIVPLLLVESWRFSGLGDLDSYIAWWKDQIHSISAQAGTSKIYHDTEGFLSKFLVHLGALSAYYGLPVWALLIWLIGPLVLVGALRATGEIEMRRHLPLLALMIAVGVYFLWWLLLTPTQKAWHRRILDGSVLLNLTWAYVSGIALRSSLALTDCLRTLRWMPLVGGLLFSFSFFFHDAAQSLRRGEGSPTMGQAVETLRQLRQDATILGVGWYSAPVLSLLSERRIDDFNNHSVADFSQEQNVYFVFDRPALAQGKDKFMASMYASRPLLPEGSTAQIYEVDLRRLRDATIDEAVPAATAVDLTKNGYPYLLGFYSAEGSGTRWMSSDAAVKVKYDGSPALAFKVYLPSFQKYARKDGVAVRISLDGCLLGEKTITTAGQHELVFELPRECVPENGEILTARIMTDNMIESSITADDRAASIVAARIGFAPAP